MIIAKLEQQRKIIDKRINRLRDKSTVADSKRSRGSKSFANNEKLYELPLEQMLKQMGLKKRSMQNRLSNNEYLREYSQSINNGGGDFLPALSSPLSNV